MQCYKCQKDKAPEEFYLKWTDAKTKKRRAYAGYCKPCATEYCKNYREQNKAQLAAKHKIAWGLKGREWSIRKVARELGITYERALEIYALGACEICGETKDKLCIDHAHDSKKVRGLLCNRCNRSLGLLKDRVDVLEAAIIYLKRAS